MNKKKGNSGRRRRRRHSRGLSYASTTRPQTVRGLSWPTLENVGVTLGTRAAWRDNMATLLGGLMYVVVPTTIERLARVDLTGWGGYATSIGLNVLVGALFREPGYIAGTLGAAGAHLVYARMQDTKLWWRLFGGFAYRFDPTVTTSAMSDNAAPALPAGTMMRSVAGETIALYPPSPAVANVGVEDNYQRALQDNYQEGLLDNYQHDLSDNFQTSLRDNYQRTTTMTPSPLRDNYQPSLRDNFQTSLRDAFGGNDPWGNDLVNAFA